MIVVVGVGDDAGAGDVEDEHQRVGGRRDRVVEGSPGVVLLLVLRQHLKGEIGIVDGGGPGGDAVARRDGGLALPEDGAGIAVEDDGLQIGVGGDTALGLVPRGGRSCGRVRRRDRSSLRCG